MENYGGAFTRSVTRLRRPMTESVIVEATRTSALPHSKQINLGLLWGPRLLPLEGRSGFVLGAPF